MACRPPEPSRRDFYDDLGVSSNASSSEIKRAYMQLVRIHHPDKGGTTEKFQQVQNAYEQLMDQTARGIYDLNYYALKQAWAVYRYAYSEWEKAEEEHKQTSDRRGHRRYERAREDARERARGDARRRSRERYERDRSEARDSNSYYEREKDRERARARAREAEREKARDEERAEERKRKERRWQEREDARAYEELQKRGWGRAVRGFGEDMRLGRHFEQESLNEWHAWTQDVHAAYAEGLSPSPNLFQEFLLRCCLCRACSDLREKQSQRWGDEVRKSKYVKRYWRLNREAKRGSKDAVNRARKERCQAGVRMEREFDIVEGLKAREDAFRCLCSYHQPVMHHVATMCPKEVFSRALQDSQARLTMAYITWAFETPDTTRKCGNRVTLGKSLDWSIHKPQGHTQCLFCGARIAWNQDVFIMPWSKAPACNSCMNRLERVSFTDDSDEDHSGGEDTNEPEEPEKVHEDIGNSCAAS